MIPNINIAKFQTIGMFLILWFLITIFLQINLPLHIKLISIALYAIFTVGYTRITSLSVRLWLATVSIILIYTIPILLDISSQEFCSKSTLKENNSIIDQEGNYSIEYKNCANNVPLFSLFYILRDTVPLN